MIHHIFAGSWPIGDLSTLLRSREQRDRAGENRAFHGHAVPIPVKDIQRFPAILGLHVYRADPMPKTLIIIPTYNEIENLPLMIPALEALELGLEILIVDD